MAWNCLGYPHLNEWTERKSDHMADFKDYKNYDPDETHDEDVQYFCKFTFGQFFTILILEVVTLAFVFYLGAKYGTDYLKISDLDNNKPAVTEIVAGGAPDTTIAQPAGTVPTIQDAEIQALARDVIKGGGSENQLKDKVRELLDRQSGGKVAANSAVVPNEVKELENANAMGEAIQVKPEGPSVVDGYRQNEKPVAQQQTVAPVAKAEPTEGGAVKVKSSSSMSPYSIQVGSYPNMEDANAKVEEWRSKGYPSFMMIADIPDRGRWYRVRVGGFPSKEDAANYLAKIKQSDGVEGIVVINEQ